jgi:hypothetical protein
MPNYRITIRILKEWTDVFSAPDENAAREMAYAEAEKDIDIGDDEYVELVVTKLQE